MNFKRLSLINSLVAAVLVIAANYSSAEEAMNKPEVPDAVKAKTSREKRFLYQAIDDLHRSWLRTNEVIEGLQKQIGAVELLEPQRREDDLRDLLEWHQNYADWINGNEESFKDDLGRYFTKESGGGTGWITRYGEMEQGYKLLEEQFKETIKKFEDNKKELENKIERLSFELERLKGRKEAMSQTDKTDRKQLLPDRSKYDEETALKLIDGEIFNLENRIRNHQEMLRHLNNMLIEKMRVELDWISMKIRDCAALNQVANAVGSSLIPSEQSFIAMIRTYESDISHLWRKFDELDNRRSALPSAGTRRSLDRSKEISEYYEDMKSWYQLHINWLAAQIGSYEADLTEIRIMKSK